MVVVDDGSTDDSREVLRRYEDRVEVVLKEQGGQASALNAGIERCRGEVSPHPRRRRCPAPARRCAGRRRFRGAAGGSAKVQFSIAIGRRRRRPDRRGQARRAVVGAPVGDQRRAELAFPSTSLAAGRGVRGFRSEAVRRILPIPAADYPRSGADWYLVHLTALLGEGGAAGEVCASYRVHGDNAYEQDRG